MALSGYIKPYTHLKLTSIRKNKDVGNAEYRPFKVTAYISVLQAKAVHERGFVLTSIYPNPNPNFLYMHLKRLAEKFDSACIRKNKVEAQ